jgi:SnoaL-like domain
VAGGLWGRLLAGNGTLLRMGRETVELVRRLYLAWEEGDVEELLSLVDPVAGAPLPGERAAVGRQHLRRWFRHIRITYRSLRPVLQRFEDDGARVLVLGRLVGASRLEEGDLDVSWLGSGLSGPDVSLLWRRSEKNTRHDK